jgi:hypothetical protein
MTCVCAFVPEDGPVVLCHVVQIVGEDISHEILHEVWDTDR